MESPEPIMLLISLIPVETDTWQSRPEVFSIISLQIRFTSVSPASLFSVITIKE